MVDTLLSKLRGYMFWLVDSLKGSPVKFAYREIKKIDKLASDDEYVLDYNKKRFEELSKHASNTTKFYKKFKNVYSLLDFPVINKNIIKENQSKFMSEKYDKSKLFKMSTSGSTGTPFISYQNKLKKRRVNAEIIYYSEKAGYSVGENLIFLRAITDQSYKSSIKQFIQNEKLIDISNLSDERLEVVISDVTKASKNESMLLAYASTYDAIKDYFIDNTVDFLTKANITGIISGAEMLYDDTREVISKAFNCNVYSRYSNQENGVLGQDDTENNVFIINEANYIVEIFDMEKDSLVSNGAVGRIVITDLYNYAMPMIRYDTGDIGAITMIEHEGKMKKAISNFGGRRADVVYNVLGDRISPHSIGNALWSFQEIKQYQFIQEGKKNYKINISGDKQFHKKSELLETMSELLGGEATVTIEMVNEIPIMESGKRKSIVSMMN